MTAAIGIDIGGTKIAAGVVLDDGVVVAATRVPTPARGPLVVEECVRLARSLTEAAADRGLSVAGVGVGTGGVVSDEGTVVAASDLITEWAGLPVSALLAERLGLPVVADNDGNAFAAGEARWGAARAGDAICVAVGTGIGGGLVLDGRVRRGARFMAGEFGHLPHATRRVCSCGRRGHLEAVAAGPAMTRAYNARTDSTAPAADLREVAARAAAGDEIADAVLREGAEALGTAMAGVALAVDLPLLVIGGGVSALGEGYRTAVAGALAETLPHGLGVEVALSTRGPESSVAGAGSLALPR